MSRALLLFALLPLASALAADAPARREIPMKRIENNAIPLEDLAHSLFFHSRASQILEEIISEEGVNRLRPAIAEHRREMHDTRKLVAKLRQACSDLQSARNGKEFAAVLVEGENKEHNESREAARRILSKLDVDDRQALENYLDTDFRLSTVRTRVDYEAMFAAAPFPSAETTKITRRTCDAVAQAEAGVEP